MGIGQGVDKKFLVGMRMGTQTIEEVLAPASLFFHSFQLDIIGRGL